MSILIKDMEIPENCTRCDYIGLNVAIGCPVMSGLNGRATDCPLVEVPTPHGRLIDADATVKVWSGCTFRGNLSPLIEVRPTVIEAEGEEHDER